MQKYTPCTHCSWATCRGNPNFRQRGFGTGTATRDRDDHSFMTEGEFTQRTYSKPLRTEQLPNTRSKHWQTERRNRWTHDNNWRFQHSASEHLTENQQGCRWFEPCNTSDQPDTVNIYRTPTPGMLVDHYSEHHTSSVPKGVSGSKELPVMRASSSFGRRILADD